MRMWWLAVAVAAAIAVASIVAWRVLDRDRSRLHASFAQERLQGLEEAARALEGDVAEIGEDIDLAATLLENAESAAVAGREIHAIATIKREYFVIEAHGGDSPLRVVALDAPAGLAHRVEQRLAMALERARAAPGRVHVLEAVDDASSWYRIYAGAPRGRRHAIAIVVDTSLLVARLKLVPEPMSVVGLIAPTGRTSTRTDPRIAALVARPPLRELVEQTRTGATGTTTLDGASARELALPATTAVAIAVPLRIDAGAPWTLLVIRSTAVLEAQEQTLVRRILVLGGLVLALILAAGAYVTRNARRTATLRESLRHADRQRRIEERLLHSEKLVTAGQLAAGIAHEVGTPLNIARGRAELLQAKLPEGSQDRANHQIIIEQIDRVTRLIHQLLDYVRPTTTTNQPLDLSAAMHATVELLAPEAGKRHVELRCQAPPRMMIDGDPDRLQQILVNLVMNGIDACTRGGHVELRASAGEVLQLEVIDDGEGIAPELAAHVFDPFFTTKKRGQGTGLGLWIVAQLVRAQGAELDIDSAPGRGTTVRIRWVA